VDGRHPTIDTFLIRSNAYPAKILEKGCPTWPDNRGCTVIQTTIGCSAHALTALAIYILYISNFCNMIEQLHELKIAVVNTEAFRNLIMFQHGKRKTESLLDCCT